MNSFKRNTRTGGSRRAVIVAAATLGVAVIATIGLVSQITRTAVVAAEPAAVQSSDGSFDRAEYQRQIALIQDRTDGFQTAEDARFERQRATAARTATADAEVDGFVAAERARFERLDR